MSLIDTNIWHYVSVWKDIFKKEIHKISLDINIDKWILVTEFDDREH